MGRVYNALLRAEKWKDGDRTIGRPDSKDSARGRDGAAATACSYNVSAAATERSAFEDTLPLTEELVTSATGGATIAAESADEGASRRVTRAAAPPARRVIPEPPVSSTPVFTFEEPIEVSNIRGLAIDPRVATLTREDPLAVERYRALAVKLLNLAERRKLKTLLITSAETGEGKTMVATVVAWLLAKHPERRVLLIDANPGSPSVGRILGIDSKRGWLNLVDHSCELKHALVRLDPNGLYVMTPGAPAANQATDAMSSRLEGVIAELARRFDLVLVDSPAILESPEAQRLAAVLDGAVIVARAGHTHHSKVTAARKLVPKERRLGVVLNESEADGETAHRRRRKSSLAVRLFGRKR